MIAAGRLEHMAPRLAKAYEHLFDAAMPAQAHDALFDVRACAAIWLELQERARQPAWLQERWPACPSGLTETLGTRAGPSR
jgi:DNA polymerase III epsilon subunit-like protein